MFTRKYLELAAELGLALRESPSPSILSPKRTSESAVAQLWMKQPWAPHPVRDVQGRLVWIVSPGWMRGGGGPDFTGASFKLADGQLIKGDVEIHVRSSDWKRHGHHVDPAYAGVRLHVVLECDVSQARLTCQGDAPLELEMKSAFPAWRDALRLDAEADPSKVSGPPETGACAPHFARIGRQDTMDLLDAAGEGRLILKSEKLARELAASSADETLYRGLMEVFGYSRFRFLFRKLADSLPLETLRPMVADMDRRTRPAALQAVLLGMAGLAPAMGKAMDDETEIYLSQTHDAWRRLQEAFALSPILSRSEWKLNGTRPANYPMGRLAGMSYFLAANLEGNLETLFARVLWEFPVDAPAKEKQKWLDKISGLFSPTSTADYWQYRHVIGGARLARPRALAGADRVALFVINVAIPFFLARAAGNGDRAGERKLRAIAHAIPRPEANAFTKYMAQRLFSGKAPRGMMDAVRDQGLLQLYADFCLMDPGGCQGCAMADYLARRR
jgi:hypothetical protein